ncbi:MAG: O-antigen ligase family protein [Acidobacteriaceae bacterium]
MLIALIVVLALVTLFTILRSTPEKTVTSLYLPVLLLWPFGYGWKFKGVEIDLLMTVALPLTLALLWRAAPLWKFSLLDLLLLLYIFSATLSEWHADGQSSGLVQLVSSIWDVVPPYVIGRYVVERRGARVPFVRRIVLLMFLVSLLSLYEYRMEANPFRRLAGALTHLPSEWEIQIRWGFGRIAGPYAHAILAGTLLVAGLLLSMWLASRGHWEAKFQGFRWLPGRKSTYITLGLLGGVWMTQSRGPWMGGVFGLLLLLAGRARNVRRALRRSVLLALAVFAVFTFYTSIHTDPQQVAATQNQENTPYRREWIENYTPVVETGGLLGHGLLFPSIEGQRSIDNQYLNVALQQGYLGLGVFLLIIGMTGWRLLRAALLSSNEEDITFCFCLLGVFASICMTISTVYLGAQLNTFFFLLAGWAQAIRLQPSQAPVYQPIAMPARFAFRRVFN